MSTGMVCFGKILTWSFILLVIFGWDQGMWTFIVLNQIWIEWVEVNKRIYGKIGLRSWKWLGCIEVRCPKETELLCRLCLLSLECSRRSGLVKKLKVTREGPLGWRKVGQCTGCSLEIVCSPSSGGSACGTEGRWGRTGILYRSWNQGDSLD